MVGPALNCFARGCYRFRNTACAESETDPNYVQSDPAASGNVTGALHRTWTNVVASLTGTDEHAVLEECERGDDAAMRAYGAALEKDLPAEVGVIVRRQYAGVKKNHDRIRALRDQTARAI